MSTRRIDRDLASPYDAPVVEIPSSGVQVPRHDAVPPRQESHRRTWPRRLARVVANLVGATGAAFFAAAGLHHYQSTHSFVGAVFFAEELWIVVAFLVRRPASRVTARTSDWLLAVGGTFGGLLFRPTGIHSQWGVHVGLYMQLVGLSICIVSFCALGRSFGLTAANRGLKYRGSYALVRHPLYASYVLLQLGYVVQSFSWANVGVMVALTSCNVGRVRAEERLLLADEGYGEYRRRVRWRLLPGIW